MKKILVLLVVFGFAGVASSAVVEDWEAWTVGDGVNSADGWVDLTFAGATHTGLTIEAAGVNGSNSAGSIVGTAKWTGTGAAHAIDAELLGGSTHTVSVMIDTSKGANNLAYLYIGDSSLVTGAPTNGVGLITKSAGYIGAGLQAQIAGESVMDYNDVSINFMAMGWHEVKIDLSLDVSGNVTAASASYRDVDDVTGVGGAWNFIANYTGLSPFQATHVGLWSRSGNTIDAPLGKGPDFDNLGGVFVPEPATLGLLATGGLLTLLRHRRQ